MIPITSISMSRLKMRTTKKKQCKCQDISGVAIVDVDFRMSTQEALVDVEVDVLAVKVCAAGTLPTKRRRN